jgi:tRNA-dihydrouridine synthase 1
MSAEGQLYNVALFIPSQTPSTSGGLHLPHADLALEYLDIVSSLRTPTPPSGIKGHLFKLLRPALSRETDLRHSLGELRGSNLAPYYEVVREMKRRMDSDAEAARGRDAEAEGGFQHWMAQPYVRPLPAPPETVARRSHSNWTPEPANGDEVKRIRHNAVQILASVTTAG